MKTVAISREGCVGCQPREKSSASKGWNAVPKEWSTWQHSTADNSVCKQKCKSAEAYYSDIEREALAILHGLKKIHQYFSPTK